MTPRRRAKGTPGGPALVTGGAGFIGSHLVDALVGADRPTAIVDDLSHGRLDRVPSGVDFTRADVSDGEALARIVARVTPRVIFHLAAQIDVRRAVADPVFDATANIVGMINVLESARSVGARVVFASSGGAAYGERSGLTIPTPEHEPPEPQSPYGLSKVCAEEYCRLYARLHGVDAVTLRLSNVYGPRQDPFGEGGVVAIFCGCAADGREPTIYGDGEQTRDYIFVGDVVDAFLLAESGPPGAVLNIGTGIETSVLDLLAAIPEAPEPNFAAPREGEVARSALDTRRATE